MSLRLLIIVGYSIKSTHQGMLVCGFFATVNDASLLNTDILGSYYTFCGKVQVSMLSRLAILKRAIFVVN